MVYGRRDRGEHLASDVYADYIVFKVTEMIATAIFVGSRETLGKLVCEKAF